MNQNRVLSSLRMSLVSQASMMGIPLSGYSKRLPRWGWMRSGHIYELAILERPTSANDGSAWLTPTVDDATSRTLGAGMIYETLSGTVRRKNTDGTSSNLGLRHMVNWKTLQARDWKGASGRAYKGIASDLPSDVMWSTPNTVDAKGGNRLGEGQAQLCHQAAPQAGQSLNPDWVETLMGLPLGWTDLDHTPHAPANRNSTLNRRVSRPERTTALHASRRSATQWRSMLSTNSCARSGHGSGRRTPKQRRRRNRA